MIFWCKREHAENMHVNVQEVYANYPCSVVPGFSMHETVPMQTMSTFFINCADLAFPECRSKLTVHLKASLIPLQRSSHQKQTHTG